MPIGFNTGNVYKGRRLTSGTTVIVVGGGSNVRGNGTGTPWLTKPSTVTYYRYTGTMNLTGAWPTDPGIAMPLIDEYVNVLGHTGPITIVEYGVPSSSYQTWQTATTGDMQSACNAIVALGLRPTFWCEYLGSADAKSHANAVAIEANLQTTWERCRTMFGGGVAFLQAGVHIPESGWDSDHDLVAQGMINVVQRHKGSAIDGRTDAMLAQFINMLDLPIQGFGSDHITGGAPLAAVVSAGGWSSQPANGTPGGCDIAGRRFARAIHEARLAA